MDPGLPLFPLLDAAALQKRDAAETDLGPFKTISEVAYSFACLPPKDLRQKRSFEGPDPFFPVCTQKRRHKTASYKHILIYARIFLSFSNPEGTTLFLLSTPASSTKTSPSTKGSFSHSLVNIWGDQKGCAQSFPHIQLLHDVFKFPVQALVLKKPALFHMMEGALLTEKTGYFCSFDFLLARMYRWVKKNKKRRERE